LSVKPAYGVVRDEPVLFAALRWPGKPSWKPYLAADSHRHPAPPSHTEPRNTWPDGISSQARL